MIMAGGIVALGVLIWQGVLWQCLRRTWQVLLHLFLTRDRGMMTSPDPRPPIAAVTMPYALAIVSGMAALAALGPIR
jgi:hypothetical protein